MNRTAKAKVLIIDDEPDNLEPITHIPFLVDEYHIVFATSGHAGLELLDGDTDVVISDHRMPGMLGIDTLEEVKKRYPDCVRILLTAFADMNLVLRALNETKCWKVIEKPYDLLDMRDTIQQAIELKESRNTQKRLASLGTISAGLAHEINSPLGIVMSNAQLISEEMVLSSSSRELIDGIMGNAHRINRVVEDVQSLVTIGDVQPLDVNITSIIREAIVIAIPPHVELRVCLAHIPPFVGYPGHFRDILVHLLSNAASRIQDREFHIDSFVENGFVKIFVGGLGDVPTKEQSFNAFFSTQSSGQGFGLTVSRAIAEACGGGLSIERDTACLWLPYRKGAK